MEWHTTLLTDLVTSLSSCKSELPLEDDVDAVCTYRYNLQNILDCVHISLTKIILIENTTFVQVTIDLAENYSKGYFFSLSVPTLC